MTRELDLAQYAALETLLDAVNERHCAETKIINSVAKLRKLKVSWAVIGSTLGMSRQAAHEKYRGS